MRIKSIAAGIAIGAVAALAGPVGIAAPAQAAANDGVCNTREYCLHYQAWESVGGPGSLRDFTTSLTTHEGHRFIGPGAGRGQFIWHNSASVDNLGLYCTVAIHNRVNWAGDWDDVRPQSHRNLVVARNRNESSHLHSCG